MERRKGTFGERRFRAMEVDGSSLYIYDRRCVRHDAYVGAWRRRRGVLSQDRAVLLEGVSPSDRLIVRCEEEAPYCHKLRNVMKNVNLTETPTAVHLALKRLERP